MIRDPQLSPWLRYRNHLHPVVHRDQDILASKPGTDWHLKQLAQRVFMSAHHLSRLFRAYLDLSIRAYHEQLRLSVAEQWLQQGIEIAKAALCASFTSSCQLRRAQAHQQTH